MATRTITLSASSWTQSVTKLYYDDVAKKFYTDTAHTEEVTSIPLPTRETYRFDGYWNSSSSSAAKCWINPDGTFNTAWKPTASTTIYIHQTHMAYKVTLNPNGGEVGDAAIYYGIVSPGFYADDLATDPTASVRVPPAKLGNSFAGFWSGSTSGTLRVNSDGAIADGWTPTSDTTIYARYTANTYTITFDYGEGSGDTASKQVTFGEAIGALPSATYAKGRFSHWEISGATIRSTTTYEVGEDATAVAVYELFFGDVKDYFGLASANLVPVSSEGGEGNRHTVVYNAQTETPGSETSGVWMNPRVTYEVVGDAVINVTLGKGFAGEVYNNGNTHYVEVTGYMIASVEVHTAISEPPRVTVSAVANEGFIRNSVGGYVARATDAIKTYPLTLRISPRHRPQDIGNALALNGYDLQEMTLTARCDPVVVAEDGVPCASDVCHGHEEISARIADYGDGTSITARTGWVITTKATSLNAIGYKAVSVNARKELN